MVLGSCVSAEQNLRRLNTWDRELGDCILPANSIYVAFGNRVHELNDGSTWTFIFCWFFTRINFSIKMRQNVVIVKVEGVDQFLPRNHKFCALSSSIGSLFCFCWTGFIQMMCRQPGQNFKVFQLHPATAKIAFIHLAELDTSTTVAHRIERRTPRADPHDVGNDQQHGTCHTRLGW